MFFILSGIVSHCVTVLTGKAARPNAELRMGEREYYAVLPSINCRRYPVKVVVLHGFRKYARVLQKLYPIVTHDMTEPS